MRLGQDLGALGSHGVSYTGSAIILSSPESLVPCSTSFLKIPCRHELGAHLLSASSCFTIFPVPKISSSCHSPSTPYFSKSSLIQPLAAEHELFFQVPERGAEALALSPHGQGSIPGPVWPCAACDTHPGSGSSPIDH